jgi:hypothetical protein
MNGGITIVGLLINLAPFLLFGGIWLVSLSRTHRYRAEHLDLVRRQAEAMDRIAEAVQGRPATGP